MSDLENGLDNGSDITKIVKIEWESDEGYHFPLAGHMMVNFDSGHFYIRFFQVTPPAVRDFESTPDSVKGKLVAGVAVPSGQMPSVIQALEANYETYLKTVNRGGDEATPDNRWKGEGDDE